jgi:hypothetical protein
MTKKEKKKEMKKKKEKKTKKNKKEVTKKNNKKEMKKNEKKKMKKKKMKKKKTKKNTPYEIRSMLEYCVCVYAVCIVYNNTYGKTTIKYQVPNS